MDNGGFQAEKGLNVPLEEKQPPYHRKVSGNEKAQLKTKRNQYLVEMRELVQMNTVDNNLNIGQLNTLLSDKRFCQILFNLFVDEDKNVLEQEDWFSQMKDWTEVRHMA